MFDATVVTRGRSVQEIFEPPVDAVRRSRDALQHLSETGEWDPWIAFFAKAIRAQAEDSASRVDRLLAFREHARARPVARLVTAASR